jgi:DNA-directed RNA polymerase subunit M/transcription elongation factor TFIIS
MEFCPECGKLLIPKKKGKSKILACSKCGYEHKVSDVIEVVDSEGESGFTEAEIEARRERFIEGIDFFETE